MFTGQHLYKETTLRQ